MSISDSSKAWNSIGVISITEETKASNYSKLGISRANISGS
jgi:hypothetical protein